MKELIEDPLETIKKHGINFLEEIPLTNYLEAAFGYDLYGNKLDSEERFGKVETAVQQGMDALLSAYMMGGIEVVGGSIKPTFNHREKYLKQIDNENLKNAISELYRPTAFIGDGGTAAKLIDEFNKGQPLRHLQKSKDMISYLENIIKIEKLVSEDEKLARQILNDLYNAVKYVLKSK